MFTNATCTGCGVKFKLPNPLKGKHWLCPKCSKDPKIKNSPPAPPKVKAAKKEAVNG